MPHTAFTKKPALDLPTTCVLIWITANSKMPILNPEGRDLAMTPKTPEIKPTRFFYIFPIYTKIKTVYPEKFLVKN